MGPAGQSPEATSLSISATIVCDRLTKGRRLPLLLYEVGLFAVRPVVGDYGRDLHLELVADLGVRDGQVGVADVGDAERALIVVLLDDLDLVALANLSSF